MGSKSRGNWNIGICFDDCECPLCRKKRQEKVDAYSRIRVENTEKGLRDIPDEKSL